MRGFLRVVFFLLMSQDWIILTNRNMASLFFCAEVTASLMRLRFNFSSSNVSFHLRLHEITEWFLNLLMYQNHPRVLPKNTDSWNLHLKKCLPDAFNDRQIWESLVWVDSYLFGQIYWKHHHLLGMLGKGIREWGSSDHADTPKSRIF